MEVSNDDSKVPTVNSGGEEAMETDTSGLKLQAARRIASDSDWNNEFYHYNYYIFSAWIQCITNIHNNISYCINLSLKICVMKCTCTFYVLCQRIS